VESQWRHQCSLLVSRSLKELPSMDHALPVKHADLLRAQFRLATPLRERLENHAHMIAIYFMHYNFVRIHQTLRITPAMAAGVTAKLWEIADLVKVLEDWEAAI
jgi:hypothetical protein